MNRSGLMSPSRTTTPPRRLRSRRSAVGHDRELAEGVGRADRRGALDLARACPRGSRGSPGRPPRDRTDAAASRRCPSRRPRYRCGGCGRAGRPASAATRRLAHRRRRSGGELGDGEVVARGAAAGPELVTRPLTSTRPREGRPAPKTKMPSEVASLASGWGPAGRSRCCAPRSPRRGRATVCPRTARGAAALDVVDPQARTRRREGRRAVGGIVKRIVGVGVGTRRRRWLGCTRGAPAISLRVDRVGRRRRPVTAIARPRRPAGEREGAVGGVDRLGEGHGDRRARGRRQSAVGRVGGLHRRRRIPRRGRRRPCRRWRRRASGRPREVRPVLVGVMQPSGMRPMPRSASLRPARRPRPR